MTDDQIDTWLAALFDGEGGFHIGTDSKGYNSFKMFITQTWCDELLYLIEEVLGIGWVEPGSAWRCAGKPACLALLDRIQPYLVVKKHCAVKFRNILSTVRTEGRDLTQEQRDKRKELLDEWQATCTRAARIALHARLKTVQE